MNRTQLAILGAIAILAVGTARLSNVQPDVASQVDHIFQRWSGQATPGCAVGAAVDGKPVLTRAYGMADLEHDVWNTPDTIFEAGSVSKQFTAAAVLLLVRDGKLALDDPVRKYVPELPDYGAPLTIQHMLNHTSGLRDWGSVESIAGWPRTSRAYTHAHVLDILSRQRSLNFPSGTRWSYSNSGYNLAAIIVSRVSGMPFATFTRTRIFEPLGMAHTSWRDDFTRVVKSRAIAYADGRDGFHTEMPFENIHGNGGLLTTVGDLLKWNENFETPKVGDAAFVARQQQAGHYNDGRVHHYAYGLEIGTYKGVRQVDHSGSTAGYRAHLARYPDQHVSVAVLCNVTSGAATEYAHEVADLYLGDRAKAPAPPAATYTLTASDADRIVGLYRDTVTGVPLTVSREKDGIRVQRSTLVPSSATKFVTAAGSTWELDPKGRLRATDPYGSVDVYERVGPAKPTAGELAAFAGTYTSDEAEIALTVAVDGDVLVIKRRPDTVIKLAPAYADVFNAPSLGTVIFRRDSANRVNALSISEGRVWDLRFSRQAASGEQTSQ